MNIIGFILTQRIIKQRIKSLFLSVTFLTYLIASIDFTKYSNDQNTIRIVISEYIQTLKMEVDIKDNT